MEVAYSKHVGPDRQIEYIAGLTLQLQDSDESNESQDSSSTCQISFGSASSDSSSAINYLLPLSSPSQSVGDSFSGPQLLPFELDPPISIDKFNSDSVTRFPDSPTSRPVELVRKGAITFGVSGQFPVTACPKKTHAAKPSTEHKEIAVKNLDCRVTEAALSAALFKEVGPIHLCKILADSRNKSHAIISFAQGRDALKAVEKLHNKMFLDSPVSVRLTEKDGGSPVIVNSSI